MLVFFVLAAAFLVKVPFFGKPLVGYFGSYQATNAMMAQMMIDGPWQNFVAPRTFALFAGEPSLHLIYYPTGAFTAVLLKLLLGGDLVFWGHFQAAMYMFFAGWTLFNIVRRMYGRSIAVAAVAIFSFFPMVLSIGISMQNEAAALFFLLLSCRFLPVRSLWGVAFSGLAFGVVLVSRIHFGAILPLLLFWDWSEQKKLTRLAIFLSGLAIPVVLCFGYFYHVEMMRPQEVMTSLFVQSGQGRILDLGLFGNPEFFRRVLDMLAGLWATPMLLGLAALSLSLRDRLGCFWSLWLVFSFSVVILLPQKVHDHPFYLIYSLPALAVLSAVTLGKLAPVIGRVGKIAFWCLFLFFSARFYAPIAFSGGGDKVKIPKIAAYVGVTTKPEDRIIAQHGTSPALLFHCKRLGWGFDLEMSPARAANSRVRQLAGDGDPILYLEKLRTAGAAYLVISEPELFNAQEKFSEYVRRSYASLPVLDPDFLVFDLKGKTI